MEHVANGKMLRLPLRDAVASDAATGDQTTIFSSKFGKKMYDYGGFYGSYDAVQGRGHGHGSRNKRRQESEGVAFDASFENYEEELQLNALNEYIETAHDDAGSSQPWNGRRNVHGKSYSAESYIDTKKSLVYVADYIGEGAHWLLEKLV